MLASILGSDLSLTVSDPWEFGTECGVGPFVGRVLQVGPSPWETQDQALLLQVKEPLTFKGVTCQYFIATARLERDDLEDLVSGREVNCNLTRIPPERATSTTPFDLTWWRGGIALMGTLRTN